MAVNRLAEIRKRFEDLKECQDITPELMLAHLVQIVNDCENKRNSELRAAESLERQALASRAKADGFSIMQAVVYNSINIFVLAAERQKREEEEIAKMEAEVEAEAVKESKPEEEPSKKASKVKKRKIKKRVES